MVQGLRFVNQSELFDDWVVSLVREELDASERDELDRAKLAGRFLHSIHPAALAVCCKREYS